MATSGPQRISTTIADATPAQAEGAKRLHLTTRGRNDRPRWRKASRPTDERIPWLWARRAEKDAAPAGPPSTAPLEARIRPSTRAATKRRRAFHTRRKLHG